MVIDGVDIEIKQVSSFFLTKNVMIRSVASASLLTKTEPSYENFPVTTIFTATASTNGCT